MPFLLEEPSFQPHHMPFMKNLGTLGIDAKLRIANPVMRLSAAMILSMSPSMTGSEIPARFCEPFKAAACEEIAAQRVTRRVRKAEPLNCEVEVEIVDALTKLDTARREAETR